MSNLPYELWGRGTLTCISGDFAKNSIEMGELSMGIPDKNIFIPVQRQLTFIYDCLFLKFDCKNKDLKLIKIYTDKNINLNYKTLFKSLELNLYGMEQGSELSIPNLSVQNLPYNKLTKILENCGDNKKQTDKHFMPKRKSGNNKYTTNYSLPFDYITKILRNLPFREHIFEDKIVDEENCFFIDISEDKYFKNNTLLYVENNGKLFSADFIKINQKKDICITASSKYHKTLDPNEDIKKFSEIIIRICLYLFNEKQTDEIKYKDILAVFKDKFKGDHREFEDRLKNNLENVMEMINSKVFLFSHIIF